MKSQEADLYYKGYIAGYRDGLKAAHSGQSAELHDESVTGLPILAMALSSRARNCLTQAGCRYVSDVAMLSERQIATMRNLGTITAAEIANWLDTHGICYSAWNQYL